MQLGFRLLPSSLRSSAGQTLFRLLMPDHVSKVGIVYLVATVFKPFSTFNLRRSSANHPSPRFTRDRQSESVLMTASAKYQNISTARVLPLEEDVLACSSLAPTDLHPTSKTSYCQLQLDEGLYYCRSSSSPSEVCCNGRTRPPLLS